MFIHGLVKAVFVILCLLLILVVLLQKGKGGTGLFGSMASTQIKLFGGSGGQDLFQRATWIMGGLVMALSLLLAVFNTNQTSYGQYAAPIEAQMPVPAEPQ